MERTTTCLIIVAIQEGCHFCCVKPNYSVMAASEAPRNPFLIYEPVVISIYPNCSTISLSPDQILMWASYIVGKQEYAQCTYACRRRRLSGNKIGGLELETSPLTLIKERCYKQLTWKGISSPPWFLRYDTLTNSRRPQFRVDPYAFTDDNDNNLFPTPTTLML